MERTTIVDQVIGELVQAIIEVCCTVGIIILTNQSVRIIQVIGGPKSAILQKCGAGRNMVNIVLSGVSWHLTAYTNCVNHGAVPRKQIKHIFGVIIRIIECLIDTAY